MCRNWHYVCLQCQHDAILYSYLFLLVTNFNLRSNLTQKLFATAIGSVTVYQCQYGLRCVSFTAFRDSHSACMTVCASMMVLYDVYVSGGRFV